MSACLRGVFGCFLLLLGNAFSSGNGAWAIDSMPQGATGVLEINVKVEGTGTENAGPGAGLESRAWSVLNVGAYRLTMIAEAPIVEGSRTAGTGSGSDNEADWEQEYEARTEACNGDPNCEMQVAMEQMNDPRAQLQMGELTAMMSAVQSGASGSAPNAQIWNMSLRAGSVQIQQEEDAFGVISETGGTVDVRCTSSTDQPLDTKRGGSPMTMHAVLTINTTESSYTLNLPVEEAFTLKRRCDNGRESYEEKPAKAASLLGDSPVGKSGWGPVLMVQGAVSRDGGNLVFDGHKVVRASVLNYADRIATVTIAWRFSTAGTAP